MRGFRLAMVAVAALAFVGIDSGCSGQQARSKVLAPAARAAWNGETGIKSEVEMGPVAPPGTLADFDAAVNNKADSTVLLGMADTAWPEIKAVAESNIQAAPWSGGVKASSLERVRVFSEALQALKPLPPPASR